MRSEFIMPFAALDLHKKISRRGRRARRTGANHLHHAIPVPIVIIADGTHGTRRQSGDRLNPAFTVVGRDGADLHRRLGSHISSGIIRRLRPLVIRKRPRDRLPKSGGRGSLRRHARILRSDGLARRQIRPVAKRIVPEVLGPLRCLTPAGLGKLD